MKIIKSICLIGLISTIPIANSFAQVSASAFASANIVSPINISNTAALNFGNLSVGNTIGGQLILAPDGTRITTNGITLPAMAGIVSAAAFTVGGSGVYTYSITLPASLILTHLDGFESMTVGSFTSTPSGTGKLNAGVQNITVGATLTIKNGQLPGVYHSPDFNVTVNYN